MNAERAKIIALEWLIDDLAMLCADEIDDHVADEIGPGAPEDEQAAGYALLADAFNAIEAELRQRLAALQPEAVG